MTEILSRKEIDRAVADKGVLDYYGKDDLAATAKQLAEWLAMVVSDWGCEGFNEECPAEDAEINCGTQDLCRYLSGGE